MLALGIFWFVFGFCLMIMAGLTWHFEERHFHPLWLLFLGPLGVAAWRLSEKREQRKQKK